MISLCPKICTTGDSLHCEPILFWFFLINTFISFQFPKFRFEFSHSQNSCQTSPTSTNICIDSCFRNIPSNIYMIHYLDNNHFLCKCSNYYNMFFYLEKDKKDIEFKIYNIDIKRTYRNNCFQSNHYNIHNFQMNYSNLYHCMLMRLCNTLNVEDDLMIINDTWR